MYIIEVNTHPLLLPPPPPLKIHTYPLSAYINLICHNFHRDVHIIEVDAADTAPPLGGGQMRTTDILVDITSRAKRPRHKNLLLLLKAHAPVRWKVVTQSLRGSIYIIVSRNRFSYLNGCIVYMWRVMYMYLSS